MARVLVADDNQDMVLTMVALLRAEGHEAEGCFSGMEALDCIERYAPDVVLMDIAMPGMSGWQAAESIRKRWAGQRPLLIAITGEYTKSSDKVLSQLRGFDYYLVKPVDTKTLLALIKKVAG